VLQSWVNQLMTEAEFELLAKREVFALVAMHALLAHPNVAHGSPEALAKTAFYVANAMIEEAGRQ